MRSITELVNDKRGMQAEGSHIPLAPKRHWGITKWLLILAFPLSIWGWFHFGKSSPSSGVSGSSSSSRPVEKFIENPGYLPKIVCQWVIGNQAQLLVADRKIRVQSGDDIGDGLRVVTVDGVRGRAHLEFRGKQFFIEPGAVAGSVGGRFRRVPAGDAPKAAERQKDRTIPSGGIRSGSIGGDRVGG